MKNRFTVFNIIILFTALSLGTTVFAAKIGEVIKDSSGDPVGLTYNEAEKYCKSIRARLPEQDEFANLAKSRGSRFSRSKCTEGFSCGEDEEKNYKEHGWSVINRNALGHGVVKQVDVTYYDSRAYKKPGSSEERLQFWVFTQDATRNIPLVWTFDGSSGAFIILEMDSLLAVRCAVK